MIQQIVSAHELFHHVKENGIYLVGIYFLACFPPVSVLSPARCAGQPAILFLHIQSTHTPYAYHTHRWRTHIRPCGQDMKVDIKDPGLSWKKSKI